MRLLTALKLAYSGFARGDEQARYTLAEKIAELIYPKNKFSEFGRLFLEDAPFIEQYVRLSGHPTNWRSLDRKFTLDQLAQAVAHLAGDTAECGAFEGASSWFMCRRMAGQGKMHHIFDSFEGLSRPGENDGTYWASGNLATTESVTRNILSAFDFVRYYKGWIPERFPEVAQRRFCLVHIDVDLYDPTFDSIAFFYERMTPGGFIVCDDYDFNSCPGAKLAMDNFLKDKPESVVRLPTGQAFIIKQ